MKVVHEERWATTCGGLNASEEGRDFLAFFQAWFDAAELLTDEVVDPAEAMRKSLTATEEELGMLSTSWLGQQLCVASMHWVHGKDMVEDLTNLEMRVMEEALARKFEELNAEAEKAPSQA